MRSIYFTSGPCAFQKDKYGPRTLNIIDDLITVIRKYQKKRGDLDLCTEDIIDDILTVIGKYQKKIDDMCTRNIYLRINTGELKALKYDLSLDFLKSKLLYYTKFGMTDEVQSLEEEIQFREEKRRIFVEM